MSKRKGDFRSKIDSILADDPADARPDGETTGLVGVSGAKGAGGGRQANARLSRHVAPTTETKLDEIEVARIKLPRGRRVNADAELSASIGKTGILQPLLLRPTANGYEVLDGGRRLAVARDLGLNTVPAVVRTIGDAEAKAMSAERKAPTAGASSPLSAAPRRPATTPPAPLPAATRASRKPAPAAALLARTPAKGRPVLAAGAAAAGVTAARKAGRPAVTTAAPAVPVRVLAKAAGRAAAKPVAGTSSPPAVSPKPEAPAARRIEKSAVPTAARAAANTRTAPGPVTAPAAPASSTPSEAATPVPAASDKGPAKAAGRVAGAAAATVAVEAAATGVAADLPGRNRARRAPTALAPPAAAVLAGVADTEATLVPGGADDTTVITRPSSTPSLARLEVPEDAAGAPKKAEDIEASEAAQETIIWRHPTGEAPGFRPVAVPNPTPLSPAFPRPALQPAQRQVAAASTNAGEATAVQGSAGKLLADWVAFPLAAGALAFAVTNLVIFNNLELFLESGAVCAFALAVFGVLYFAGRRA